MKRLKIEHQGRIRTAVVIEPENPAPGRPLLLFFHGSLQSANVARNFTDHSFDALVSRGITVAYPDGVEHHFNDARCDFDEQTRVLGVDDVGFARALIDALDCGGDVFACGFSNGGQMVVRLLLDAPGLLTGAATIAASMPTEDNLIDGLRDPLPTPFISLHGTGDPIVPYEGGLAGTANQTRGKVRSAIDTARFFADVNGLGEDDHIHSVSDGLRRDRWEGEFPVELITVDGMGHVVPCAKEVDPVRLGPSTTKIVAAEAIADFFGL